MDRQLMITPEPFTYSESESFSPELEGSGPPAGIGRNSPDYIRWVQDSLNKILGLRLAADGIMGPATRSAVRSFQQKQGLAADGVVGPQTETALKTALGAKRPQRVQAAVPVLSRGRAFPVAMRRAVVSAVRPPVVQQLPPSPSSQVPTPTRATPRALTYSTKDVIDKRISVPAAACFGAALQESCDECGCCGDAGGGQGRPAGRHLLRELGESRTARVEIRQDVVDCDSQG